MDIFGRSDISSCDHQGPRFLCFNVKSHLLLHVLFRHAQALKAGLSDIFSNDHGLGLWTAATNTIKWYVKPTRIDGLCQVPKRKPLSKSQVCLIHSRCAFSSHRKPRRLLKIAV